MFGRGRGPGGRSARADTGDDRGLAAEIQEEGERSVTAYVALSDIVCSASCRM